MLIRDVYCQVTKLSQVPKIELFVNVANGFQPLTISAKISILDVSLGSEYVFG